jgi:hypothetical protein
LGIGATAARHALDVEIGVRIPDPQPRTLRKKPERFVFKDLPFLFSNTKHTTVTKEKKHVKAKLCTPLCTW